MQSDFVAVDAGWLPGKYSLWRGTSGLKCLAFSFRPDRLAATIFLLALHHPHASPLLVVLLVALLSVNSVTLCDSRHAHCPIYFQPPLWGLPIHQFPSKIVVGNPSIYRVLSFDAAPHIYASSFMELAANLLILVSLHS